MNGAYPVPSAALNELQWAMQIWVGLIIFIILVFPDSVPVSVVKSFTNPVVQILAIGVIFALMYNFDPVVGLLASIAFLFLWSINFRKPYVSESIPNTESFTNFQPAIINTTMKTRMIPEEKQDQRWFVEKLLDEQPFIIEEDLVKTSAIQDDSGRASANSRVSA